MWRDGPLFTDSTPGLGAEGSRILFGLPKTQDHPRQFLQLYRPQLVHFTATVWRYLPPNCLVHWTTAEWGLKGKQHPGGGGGAMGAPALDLLLPYQRLACANGACQKACPLKPPASRVLACGRSRQKRAAAALQLDSILHRHT